MAQKAIEDHIIERIKNQRKRGKTYSQIAASCKVSITTVRTHTSDIPQGKLKPVRAFKGRVAVMEGRYQGQTGKVVNSAPGSEGVLAYSLIQMRNCSEWILDKWLVKA